MDVIRALSASLAAWLITAPAFAQYPDKPIRFIVGFTPGSGADIVARVFAQKFSDTWKVPVTVENVPGSGGSVGAERVVKAIPDGTIFYWGANGALTINPALQSHPTYDVLYDFAPVVRLAMVPSLFVVNNEVPTKSLTELIALAKAQPGKLSYATPGIGTPQHIGGELLKSLAGVDIIHVPYRGAVLTDVLGGRVPIAVHNLGAILAMVREGKLRPLAVTSLNRSLFTPDVPTVAEMGFPGFEAMSWFGLMAPAATPASIIDKVYRQAVLIAATPDLREKLEQLGVDTTTDAPEAFSAIIKSDTAKWSKVIREANIKPE
jgi:tripartite-type tricarboxylate transporter receptor subunit TctC